MMAICGLRSTGGYLDAIFELRMGINGFRARIQMPQLRSFEMVRMPARYGQSLLGLALLCQRSLSEQFGHVLPHAQ